MKAELHTSTADYHYELPPSLIAQYPTENRGDSRLLHVDRVEGSLTDMAFRDLVDLLRPGDLVVRNVTRVRHARLIGTRPSGRPAEVLLIHPGQGDDWVALGKPGSALRPGKRIVLGQGIEVETMEVLPEGYRLVRFHGGSATEAMERFGRLPLPPYIDRNPEPSDDDRYQTVYATEEGSVAAPTAGLHFTNELLRKISETGVELADVNLEVGPGTFKPVEEADVRRHKMHPERYLIPQELPSLIAATKAAGARVWAIGTTVVRALESAVTPEGELAAGSAETTLMIVPGYRFRVVDCLVTNFHLPRSTLLMLVAAFAGYRTTLAAYHHAVDRQYRFYSYGDAMVIT